MIIHANSFHIPLRDQSVHCIVTSPPYWGLRDYGLEPIIIGGDRACAHEWEEHRQYKDSPTRSGNEGIGFDDADTTRAQRWQSSQFCQHCTAWRGQLGLEPTPELYIQHMVEIFHECKRVLRDDGTLWLNLGDSYWGGKGRSGRATSDRQRERFKAGESLNKEYQQLGWKGEICPKDGTHEFIKPKDLVGIPWRVAFALQADGWYLRSDIIWAKPNKRTRKPQGILL